MMIYHLSIAALWLALVAYWVISAIATKRNVRNAAMRRQEIWLRLGVVVLVLLALRLSVFGHAFRTARLYAVNTNLPLGLTGLVLCALGMGLAVWARTCLGRNWGPPMSRKENPQLVTSGPYEYVRHPIYAGFLLAMLGSTIGDNLFWAIALIVFGIYFVYSARREERLMVEEWPEQYPAYMKRTKMFLPFIF